MRVGIDIGGTKTDAVAIDDAGRVDRSKLRLPTGFGAEAVLATAVARGRRARRAGRASTPSDFASIGVGIPGAVDRHPGASRTR